MPARWLRLVIVIFWLGTTGLLVYRDLLPRWLPGQAPPYTIDLVDEADKGHVDVHWKLFPEGQSGRPYCSARTSVTYRADDDTFELKIEMNPGGNKQPVRLGRFRLLELTGSYRVARTGELREAGSELRVNLVGEFLGQRLVLHDIKMHLNGEVHGGKFHPRCRFELPPLVAESLPKSLSSEMSLPAVEVPRQGSVLQPLHPVNRIRGLQPGQSWRLALFDPFAGATALGGTADAGPHFLLARVRPGLETLPGHPGVRCLVIDYEGDDSNPRTWVRASDGTVLRQEATVLGERLVIQRDPIRPDR